MTLKRSVLTALAALWVAYVIYVLAFSSILADPTSGSGEGNILTTQTP